MLKWHFYSIQTNSLQRCIQSIDSISFDAKIKMFTFRKDVNKAATNKMVLKNGCVCMNELVDVPNCSQRGFPKSPQSERNQLIQFNLLVFLFILFTLLIFQSIDH